MLSENVCIRRGVQFVTVIPIVVVPDDRLWAVHYDVEGGMVAPPHSVDRVPIFVAEKHQWECGTSWEPFCISHFELVTLRGLIHLLDNLPGPWGWTSLL
jgi:hypothetical protein